MNIKKKGWKISANQGVKTKGSGSLIQKALDISAEGIGLVQFAKQILSD